MHTSTKNRIQLLQKFINRYLSRWYIKYGKNVTGVRVDKKRIGKKSQNYYSIVFNVVKKVKKKDLPKKQIIPKHFNVVIENNKKKKIKTDVRQTGEFKLHSGIMDVVRDGRNGNAGSLGLFLKDRSDNVFGLTNYHVAAETLFHRHIFSYDVTSGDPRHDVVVGESICRLHIGTFEPDLDAALIFLGSGINITNELPGGDYVNNSSFIDGPIPVTIRGKMVSLYLPSQGGRIDMHIEDHQAPLSYGPVEFKALVTVNRCSDGGDSGSLVLGNKNMVIGIVLGGDDDFTYIVPYYKIYDFFPLDIA